MKNTHEYSPTLEGNEITFKTVSTYQCTGIKEITLETVNLKNFRLPQKTAVEDPLCICTCPTIEYETAVAAGAVSRH